ncbi:helicase [Patescibacteria group bacterium]|nr:helicase [Patescibacteria group bacterium]
MDKNTTFIINEKDSNLLERFKVLIKDTGFFDVMVGYFYTSGFYEIYKSLEKTEKIRILIGISTNKETVDLIQQNDREKQQSFRFSNAETKEQFSEAIINEIRESKDNRQVEEGISKFLEWLKSGKLEIKAYPAANIHAKLYIMTSMKTGTTNRVIVGSSNFTKAGLVDNLEFNVELKNKNDYEFALQKFNELWKDSIDVSKEYIETIQTKTWFNNNITPYELYLKFLYEYFKDELKQSEEVLYKYTPARFKKLEYQEQAVLNAKKILEEYGGVFISDVVGLGKTYISAMLANQLDGRNLVIAPPMLLEKDNPGSWPNVFEDFQVRQTNFESIGKLDKLLKSGIDKYKNVFIDEAHRFRTETNITYEKLSRICRGKRVILVTATPYNNHPKDILSQIKLFQKVKKSTIPGLPNLESFFSKLDQRVKKLNKQTNREKYIEISKENAKEIREKVLKYLMVRRTRSEIENYFKDDLKKQGLKFPEVSDPEAVFYELNKEEDNVFNKTIDLIVRRFKYARYTPLLPKYYNGSVSQPEKLSQENMGKFMKILLIKRLESSFFAFRNSIDRFIHSYEKFLEEFNKGNVYTSKKYINKIFEFLENDDEKRIQSLVDEDKAQKYSSKNFKKKFKEDLENDLNILKEIKKLWRDVNRDPKLLKFINILFSRAVLKNNKLIVFTESKETANYLAKNLDKKFPKQAISFSGDSSVSTREKVIENFDAGARFPKNDYRILVTTEVLSEGVNLHRSNVVINYDIPWNPTRLMQRVGRINRVDTNFSKIYAFNFFPTIQSNSQIKLRETAEAKIHAFISLLGSDARLLTDGELIGSHELFNRLISKKTITGEDEKEKSELKYLQIIKKIRDDNPDLFSKIKQLPKKSRTARVEKNNANSLLTYFRKGKLQKFFLANIKKSQELDFISAADLLEVTIDLKKKKLDKNFYKLLDINKQEFLFVTTEEMPDLKMKGGRDTATQVLMRLKAIKDFRRLTEDQEAYLGQIMRQLIEGGFPKQTTKRTLKELDLVLKDGINPLKIIAVLQKNIPNELLKEHVSESAAQTFGPREVILSEYFLSN